MVKLTTMSRTAEREFPVVREFSAGRLLAFPHLLPTVPTLLATRIQLELLLSEPLIDLRAVSAAVLRDPGATLLILRLVGTEYGLDEAHVSQGPRPIRMEECLASLDARIWFDAICRATIDPHEASEDLCAAWAHASSIAQCAMELAEHLEGYSPEEACLVGLLHELEDLPALLCWDRRLFPEWHSAEQLARAWGLPRRLIFCSENPADSDRCWAVLLKEAHRGVTCRDKVA